MRAKLTYFFQHESQQFNRSTKLHNYKALHYVGPEGVAL
jgi:hypothetical protein